MYPSFLGWKDERLVNIEVDKYLSPKLGKTITMRLFSISDRFYVLTIFIKKLLITLIVFTYTL